MHRKIEASTGRVIPKTRCNVVGERDLHIRRELTAHLGRRRRAKRAFSQRYKPWAHVIEHHL